MSEVSDVGDPAQVQVALADVNNFLKYLRRAVPICLEEDAVSSPAFEAALGDKAHQESIRKFISDPQTRAIFIQRSSTKGMLISHSQVRLILFIVYKAYCSMWVLKHVLLFS